MDPATIALITAAVSAAGGTAAGYLGRQKQTPMQKKQYELVDDLLASLKGEGSFSDMFNADDATFQKSFVDPAKSRFNNQIAPQIEQQYIASGQQNGSGLQDTLARAGVDMDQLLNQQYANFQNSAMNRSQNAMNQILGFQGQENQSGGSAAMQGFSGYLASPTFGQNLQQISGTDDMSRLLDALGKSGTTNNQQPASRGFEKN